jgi:hypothetical protein
MFPGVDPQQLALAQRIGKNITGTITIDYKDNTGLIKLESLDPEAQKAIPAMLESFCKALGEQLNMFFSIKGRIIERNKTR